MRVATLSEMLEEVVRLGEATGMEEHAHEIRGELEGRLATVRAAVSGASSPRVIALERFDPPRVAGFWIPEMISIAGGEDVAGDPGLNPPDVGWGELASLRPDVVIVMPDGSAENARAQAMEHWELIDSLGASEGIMTRTETRASDAIAPARFKAGDRLVVVTDDGDVVRPGDERIGMLGVGGPIPLGYYSHEGPFGRFFAAIAGTALVRRIAMHVEGKALGEGAAVVMFALLGIQKDAAVALTFAHYALWLLASLPGAYLLFRSGVKIWDLERATDGGAQG